MSDTTCICCGAEVPEGYGFLCPICRAKSEEPSIKRRTNGLIYVCSPYRAKSRRERQRNIEYAEQLTRAAVFSGGTPVTPHLYMTKALDDRDPLEKEIGMAAGRRLLLHCDEIWIGPKYGISEGMRAEIELATESGILVKIVNTYDPGEATDLL